MYVNFWYPLATSEELTDKPLKVRCMGLDYVLFTRRLFVNIMDMSGLVYLD